MSRIIKFRAWDKIDNTMRTVDNINFFDEFVRIDETNNGHIQRKLDEVVLMHYTGLVDKNGKEIYEEDIVKAFSQGLELIGLIKWGGSGFFIEVPPPRCIWHLLDNPETAEIIGNIYENPDYLTSQTLG